MDGDDEFDLSRKKRRMTKEEAIYGIFFPDDSDEEEKSGRRNNQQAGYTYSTGISFVQSSKGTVEAEAKERAAEQKKREEKKKKKIQSSDGRETQGLGYSPAVQLPSSFGNRSSTRNGGGSFGTPSSSSSSSAKKAAPKPEWERYTKGVGSQLLQKMGFQGGGLKEGAISAPIEAIFKADKGGLGFGSKKQSKYASSDEEEEEAESQDEMEEGGELRSNKKNKNKKSDMWKKGTNRRAQKQIFKTAEDLLREEAKDSTKSIAKQVIIDMTRPEARVISAGIGFGNDGGVAAMDIEHTTLYQSFESKTPQFESSLRTIVDLTEKDIKKIHSKISQERDSIAKWDKQQKEVESRTTIASEQIERFKKLMKMITDCQSKIHGGTIVRATEKDGSTEELDYLFNMFVEIKSNYSVEFKSFQLATLALSMVLPLIKQRIRSWDPVLQPTTKELLDLFNDWKEILHNGDHISLSNKVDLDHFTKLTYDVLLPKMRSTINNWDPRSPEMCLRLVEGWQQILPSSVFNYILDELVQTKLKYAVDSWNPRTDVPIHKWIQPWLPIVGSRLESLYEPIKQKMAIALQRWNAIDGSAHEMLAPWKGVFDQKAMDSLLLKSVVPKLMETMKRFSVNPRQQRIEEFQSLMHWVDMLPISCVTSILDDYFWPKFGQALSTWLANKPNFEEVRRWYLGWKKMFPPPLESHPRVKQQLYSALEHMRRCIADTDG